MQDLYMKIWEMFPRLSHQAFQALFLQRGNIIIKNIHKTNWYKKKTTEGTLLFNYPFGRSEYDEYFPEWIRFVIFRQQIDLIAINIHFSKNPRSIWNRKQRKFSQTIFE